MSDNEIYLLIKYIKSVLWRAVKRLSYIEDARCLKVKCTTVIRKGTFGIEEIEPHKKKTLPQYTNIVLTAVATVHIGKSMM